MGFAGILQRVPRVEIEVPIADRHLVADDDALGSSANAGGADLTALVGWVDVAAQATAVVRGGDLAAAPVVVAVAEDDAQAIEDHFARGVAETGIGIDGVLPARRAV